VNVDKSKLRQPNEIELGPQYTGAQVSRKDLDDEQLEDDLFAAAPGGDEEIRSNQDDDENELGGRGEDVEEMGDQAQEKGSEGDQTTEDDEQSVFDDEAAGSDPSGSDGSEGPPIEGDSGVDEDENVSGDESPPKSKGSSVDRSALKAMMASEQKAVVENLSKAAQADASKGKAVKRQKASFDRLLNTRIRLQKGLVGANTLFTFPDGEISIQEHRATIEAAEDAALTLLNNLVELRASLPSHSTGGKKRALSATKSTPLSELHETLQSMDTQSLPARRSTLSKWSQKTMPASALPSRNRLSTAPEKPGLLNILDTQLTSPNLERLIQRTRIPRSCAPVQAQQSKKTNPNIFDDADWYTLLLRDLVESKMNDTSTPNGQGAAGINGSGAMTSATSLNALRREAKTHRPDVDVKASKGRKMRYSVLEKLQNFMVPDDRTSWPEKQVTELFGGLLGRRVGGGLEESGGLESDEDTVNEAGALRLFAGV